MKAKIRCLIIDDEPLARAILQQHIAAVDTLELTGTCTHAVEAISFLNDHAVDLLFLDIQMPQLLGTDFLRTLHNKPRVIFTTAYRKYALEGFELDAVDFLLKPISFERFLKAVNKIYQLPSTIWKNSELTPITHVPEPQSFLYFRSDRKMVKVLFRDILYIEALKDYIKIVATDRTTITKYVLASLEELLPPRDFLRIHKSFIVSIQRIDSYNAETVQIAKVELPIGRLYKLNVFQTLTTSSAEK